MKPLATILLTAALSVGGCGDDAAEDVVPAERRAPATASAGVSPEERRLLDEATTTISSCSEEALRGQLPGAVAIVQTLVENYPVQRSIRDAARTAAGELRECGEKGLSRRLRGTLKAAA